MRHVRFDIEQRRPVHNIHFPDLKDIIVYAKQADHGEADVVRALEMADGEDALLPVVQEGCCVKRIGVRQVKVIQKNKVGKAGDLLQAACVVRE